MRFSDLFSSCLKQINDCQKALEIELLIERAFGLDRPRFWIRKQETINDQRGLHRFYRLFNRLQSGEPLTYILGQKEFFSHVFFINRHVLIPRPETELLVEKALERIKKSHVVLDIGAGSGIISIILAMKSGCRVVAVEKSKRALTVLMKNISNFGLSEYVSPVCSDLFPREESRFNLIISNPPYLSFSDWDKLPIQIRNFEPRSALVAGPRGTEIIERIILQAPEVLTDTGYLLLEVGVRQRIEVDRCLRNSQFKKWSWFRDLRHIDRVLVAQK